MYKNVLASIPGIEWYPIVALVLFFGFFTVLIVWFFKADKKRLDALSRSILQDDVAASDPTTSQTPTQRS